MVCPLCQSDTHQNRNSLVCKFKIRNSGTNKLIENDTNRQSPKRIRNNLYSSNDLKMIKINDLQKEVV
jgi:hypothetical protein